MSAKKTKKKSGKRVVLWSIVVIEAIILAAALLVWWAFTYDGDTDLPSEPAVTETSATVPQESVAEATVPQETAPAVVEEMVETEAFLDSHLKIVNVGSYTGAYVEDGSNDIVSDVLMMVVTNFSEEDVQYAEIIMPTTAGDAIFNLSTLPAGESVVLLEQNRMAYTGEEDTSTAMCQNVAVFSEPLSLREDMLKLQILDGAINVKNISGQDISDDIVIYYKNAAADLYYGGITYRIRIEGGLKADEIKQITATHFSDSGSKIMFVTAG